MTLTRPYTAAQEILLAAADISGQQRVEFSEWDLTVAVWQRNKNKFGARGYEDKYPDHKRVMIEIMARDKKDNPLRQGWLEKTRANHYRITALGETEVDRLVRSRGEVSQAPRSAEAVYDALASYIDHRVFRDYCRDPEEPHTWLGAAAFLNLSQQDRLHLNDRLRAAENAARQGLKWFDETNEERITRGPSGGGITIRRLDVEKLSDFVKVLQERFKLQIEAIQRKD